MYEHRVYDAILARRSIRNFLQTPVEREKIEILLKAAMAAPSACNLQPWAFIVVDEAETLEKVRNAAVQGNYNAPLAIVVCGVFKHIPWEGDGWIQDCGAAAQNIMLEATELGLASVCVGGFEENELRGALDIPDDVQPLCILEIGYPAYTRAPLSWYTEEAVHWQKYDREKERTMRTLEMLQNDISAGII